MNPTHTPKAEAVLGARYKDTISGIEGVANATTLFLHGCERVAIECVSTHDGEIKEYVFDIPRLVRVDTGKPASTTDRVGGSRPAPQRTGMRPA